jgi:hypothetical protein
VEALVRHNEHGAALLRLLLKGIPALIIIAIGVYCYGIWYTPRPDTPHDPFKLGYPDDNRKPEALRQLEEYIFQEWNGDIRSLRQDLMGDSWKNKRIEEWRHMPHAHMFRSENELFEYVHYQSVKALYEMAMRSYDQKYRSATYNSSWKEIFLFLEDFMWNTRGIHPYNANNPSDRKILEDAGIKLPPIQR